MLHKKKKVLFCGLRDPRLFRKAAWGDSHDNLVVYHLDADYMAPRLKFQLRRQIRNQRGKSEKHITEHAQTHFSARAEI